MNPTLVSPQSPNLVTALVEDRMREAAELRLSSELPPVAEMDTPHRFKRFLLAATRGSHHSSPAVEAR